MFSIPMHSPLFSILQMVGIFLPSTCFVITLVWNNAWKNIRWLHLFLRWVLPAIPVLLFLAFSDVMTYENIVALLYNMLYAIYAVGYYFMLTMKKVSG